MINYSHGFIGYYIIICWRTDVKMMSITIFRFLYYIHWIDSILPCVCSAIDHR